MASSSQKPKNSSFSILIPILVIILVLLIVVAVSMPAPGGDTNSSTQFTQGTSSSSTTQPTGTTQPSGSTDSTGNTGTTDSTGTTGTTGTTDSTGTTGTTGTTGNTDPSNTTQPSGTMSQADLEAFFAESAFIGDSVTLALRNYCISKPNALYGAKILCAGSYAVRHAIVNPNPNNDDIVSITYQGEAMRPEEALRQMGVKRVFIMLGLNDIALVGIDKTIDNWATLVTNIRIACPDIEIYIQSGTPIQLGGEKGKLNNENMDKYNSRLQTFCEEYSCFYVDISSALKNEQGGLEESYCSDDYCHLTTTGVEVWIQTLKDFAINHP